MPPARDNWSALSAVQWDLLGRTFRISDRLHNIVSADSHPFLGEFFWVI